MTSISQTWRDLVVVVALVAGVLIVTATPAHAWHWQTISRSYQAPTPYDPGGRDAYVRIGNRYDSTIYGRAVLDAYGERVRVTYRAGTEMTYQIEAPPGRTIAAGTVPVPPRSWTGCALDWGYGSAGGPCWSNRAGQNVREGVDVRVRICVWLDLHIAWYCGSATGRA
jgi:hypothetical protein